MTKWVIFQQTMFDYQRVLILLWLPEGTDLALGERIQVWVNLIFSIYDFGEIFGEHPQWTAIVNIWVSYDWNPLK
jgi:hypothetical protein